MESNVADEAFEVRDWKFVKLKNRRVYHGKVPEKNGHVFWFKRLGDPEKGEEKIVNTSLTLTDEAAGAMIQLYIRHKESLENGNS